MVQNMRARLAAQQENTRKIMKNVLPGTCAALRSQDDSLVERRNAAVDQKHCTMYVLVFTMRNCFILLDNPLSLELM
jgi:hypothetical protein